MAHLESGIGIRGYVYEKGGWRVAPFSAAETPTVCVDTTSNTVVAARPPWTSVEYRGGNLASETKRR